jgi:hypothetical protein
LRSDSLIRLTAFSTPAFNSQVQKQRQSDRLTDVHRDATLREEAIARRGSYWAASEFGGQLLTDRWDVRCVCGGWVDGMPIAHRGWEGIRGSGGEVVFLDLWIGLRLEGPVGVEKERRRGRWCTRQQPQRPRTRP